MDSRQKSHTGSPIFRGIENSAGSVFTGSKASPGSIGSPDAASTESPRRSIERDIRGSTSSSRVHWAFRLIIRSHRTSATTRLQAASPELLRSIDSTRLARSLRSCTCFRASLRRFPVKLPRINLPWSPDEEKARDFACFRNTNDTSVDTFAPGFPRDIYDVRRKRCVIRWSRDLSFSIQAFSNLLRCFGDDSSSSVTGCY